MKKLLKTIQQYGFARFIRLSFAGLKLRLINRLLLGSYSQKKEDLLLDDLIGKKKSGFYIDVGACDPVWFSNTLRFYKRGWRGINIEPNIEHWKRFGVQRPRDINLNLGVGTKRGVMVYYQMDLRALSTFSKERAVANQIAGFTIQRETSVLVRPLKDILFRYAKNLYVDFLSLDVEGMEMDVLRSNDWQRYRPRFLCIETSWGTNRRQNGVTTYLRKQKYALLFDNGLNSFYKDTSDEPLLATL